MALPFPINREKRQSHSFETELILLECLNFSSGKPPLGKVAVMIQLFTGGEATTGRPFIKQHRAKEAR